MDLQPTLDNDLITIRPLRISDYDALYEVAQDPLIWEQHQFKERYKEKVFQVLFQESLASGGALIAVDKLRGVVIGSSRYKLIEGVDDVVEIGWSFLSRDYWGGQYNRAMKTLMIDHAFRFITDIIFYIDRHNFRSQKAVEKIGGQLLTDHNWNHLIKDSGTDLTYIIKRDEWNKWKEDKVR
jgi:RimJ/RimL family protein N-acetyltransferase